MNVRLALQTLLLLVLGLPLVHMTFVWVEELLAALGDTAAAGFLDNVSLGLRIVWLVSLVGLLIVVSFDAVSRTAIVETEHSEDGQ